MKGLIEACIEGIVDSRKEQISGQWEKLD